MKLRRIFKALCMPLLAFPLLCASPAWAHAGEEHSHAEEAVADGVAAVAPPVAATFPRTTAQSEEFELVASLANNSLTLYLDHYASNEPVLDAQIEVESGTLKGVARQTEPGVYVMPAAALGKPGKYPLLFSIQTETSADLLTATLQVDQADAHLSDTSSQPAVNRIDPRLYWAAGALLLLGVGVVLIRRRR